MQQKAATKYTIIPPSLCTSLLKMCVSGTTDIIVHLKTDFSVGTNSKYFYMKGLLYL